MDDFTKYIYTTINLLNHLMFGLTFSSFGPTYVDFKYLTNTDMGWVGLFPSVAAIACIIGSIFGFLYKYINRQLTLSILIILQGVATILMPYSTTIWQLYMAIFTYGLGIGAWNNSNNVILIEMWQQNSPSFLQFSQFIYGVGTILGPLIVGPYLMGEVDYNAKFHLNNGTVAYVWNRDSIAEHEMQRKTRIMFPFLIGGILQCIGPIIMFVMYFVWPYNYNTEEITEIDIEERLPLTTSADKNKDIIPKKAIIICISIFLAFGIMSENMYMDFSPTFFQFSPLHLTASKAAEIFATMSIALSTGRGLSIFIAMKLRPQTMISYQICIVFIGFIYQYLAQTSLTHLWISAIIICFGYSSIFICLFSYVGQYMQMTDKIGAIFIASYNSIYLFLPFFLGKNIEEHPDSFLYIEFGSVCIGISALLVVMFLTRKVPKECLRL